MPVISGGTVIGGGLPRGSTPLDKGEGPRAGRGLVIAKATYDFSVEGGAVSTIGLLGSTAIPSGTVIMGGYVDVRTAPTSGGAGTLALTTGEGAGDLVAAAAVSGAPWSTTGRKNIVPRLSDATTWIKTAAARDISAVIAAAALTAGILDVYLFYLPPSD
jgi:hypothetical protein